MERLEDDLRRVLRSEAPEDWAQVDAMLERVHRGAVRRRRRRRAGASVVCGLAAAGAAVAVVDITGTQPDAPPVANHSVVHHHNGVGPPTVPTPVPSRTASPPPGPAVGLTRADSLTAVTPDHLWVLGSARCGHRGCGSTVEESTDGGQTFQPLRVPWQATPARAQPTGLRFAPDGENGWAFTPTGPLWSTHDGGTSWERTVRTAAPRSVESRDGYAYGLARSGSGDTVLRSPVRRDDWTRLSVPRHLSSATDLVIGDGAVGFFARHGEAVRQVFVVSRDEGATWRLVKAPCRQVEQTSGTSDSLWLQCGLGGSRSPGGVFQYAPAGNGFDDVPAPANTGLVAAIDASHALVVDGSRLFSLASDGSRTPLAAPPDSSGPTWGGFTTPQVGYLMMLDGGVARTDDGGRSWTMIVRPDPRPGVVPGAAGH